MNPTVSIESITAEISEKVSRAMYYKSQENNIYLKLSDFKAS